MALHRWRAYWRASTLLDRAAALLFLLCLLGSFTPLARYVSGWGGWLVVLLLIAGSYLVVRFSAWVRKRLLWSLLNRLIVAYVFIAVVPVILLLAMAGLSAYLLFFQLGAHLLHDDLHVRVVEVTNIADTLKETLEIDASKGVSSNPKSVLSRPGISAMLSAAQKNLPGIEVRLPDETAGGATNLRPARRFAGLAQSGGHLWIETILPSQSRAGEGELYVRVPVTTALLDTFTPDLGPIQLTTFRDAKKTDRASDVLSLNGRRLVRTGQATSRRILEASQGWYDIAISGLSTLDAVKLDRNRPGNESMPVAAVFSVRPSTLIHRLFTSLGDFGDPLVFALVLIGVFFLALEVAALITGIVLTRTITMAVDDLYEATRHVRQGDFTHRIHVRQRDQLGVLADSFNAMTGSISELIEEQRQRQRLENELSIAREVQTQLFPRQLPTMPGLELAAICRAARVVSGDYYDFVKLGPDRLGMTIADISGKGISAALLMASLQASLRGQAIWNGHRTTGEVVANLNHHLFLNTSDDRYATLFYAEYDSSTRSLRYTNAGHVAPFFVVGQKVKKLEEGGTVVGLFDHAEYRQSVVSAEPGALFVGFSDGLLEPENVYGEEFGSARLAAEVLRLRDAPLQRLAEGLLSVVEQWAGSPEQADDMTVVVARFR